MGLQGHCFAGGPDLTWDLQPWVIPPCVSELCLGPGNALAFSWELWGLAGLASVGQRLFL